MIKHINIILKLLDLPNCKLLFLL